MRIKWKRASAATAIVVWGTSSSWFESKLSAEAPGDGIVTVTVTVLANLSLATLLAT